MTWRHVRHMSGPSSLWPPPRCLRYRLRVFSNVPERKIWLPICRRKCWTRDLWPNGFLDHPPPPPQRKELGFSLLVFTFRFGKRTGFFFFKGNLGKCRVPYRLVVFVTFNVIFRESLDKKKINKKCWGFFYIVRRVKSNCEKYQFTKQKYILKY